MASLKGNITASRESWVVGSICLVYSRSKNEWYEAKIIEISGSKNDEWCVVKYGTDHKNTKKIQRNCKDIKSIPMDHPSQFKVGSYCRIYSDKEETWCYGEVMKIFNDDEGEWLKVKYTENNTNTTSICDIQRYSKDIKLVINEDEDDTKDNVILSNQKDLETFPDIKHILIDQIMIKQRVKELGKEITDYYLQSNIDELICVGILNGGFMFCSDLIRFIKIPHRVEFMKLKSYSASKQHNVNIVLDLNCNPENKTILIIEDLIDTGKTMMWLINYLQSKNAKSVKIACLLQKKTKKLDKNWNINIDWIGFPSVPDEWIVGYGIDYDNKYRHLPYVASLKKSVYQND